MKQTNWMDLVTTVCADAGIDHGPIESIITWDQKFSGSDEHRNSAVFRIGNQRCLKLYGPSFERPFHVERSALKTLMDYADAIPAPRFIAARERTELPPYIIMTEIAGATVQDSWENLTRAEQLAIAREIGTITAEIHRLPQADLAEVERQFGGRSEYAKQMQTERIAQIEAADHLSTRQRDALLDYLLSEAQEFLNEPPVFTHSDFSHAHIYIARETDDKVKVTGFIDWAEAMLGPAEWDIAFHWFWTINQDRHGMHECLKAFYPDGQLPERFARRCLSTHLYTFSMGELFPYFVEKAGNSESIVRDMTAFFFPSDVFGQPD